MVTLAVVYDSDDGGHDELKTFDASGQVLA
jgi:hypothetical protein